MVTAELAVSLVTVVLVLAVALGAVRLGMDRTAAVSVAGALAREAGRDGDVAEVWHRSRAGLPPEASFGVREVDGMMVATVRVPARLGIAALSVPLGGEVEAVAFREGR